MIKKPIGLILGTGWGEIIKDLKDSKSTPYLKIFGHSTTVKGHSGTLIKGTINNSDVIILSGRFHTYEEYNSYEASQTIHYLHKQGVKQVIITSAVGGLNPKYQVGDMVILTDIITLFCQSPLKTNQFQDLTLPFSLNLQNKAIIAAKKSNIKYQQGIYTYVRGPHFETFSDKKALQIMGTDVVGMSTVPETIMARYLGMEILGLSMVTNLAFEKVLHEDVLANSKKMEQQFRLFFNNLFSLI